MTYACEYDSVTKYNFNPTSKSHPLFFNNNLIAHICVFLFYIIANFCVNVQFAVRNYDKVKELSYTLGLCTNTDLTLSLPKGYIYIYPCGSERVKFHGSINMQYCKPSKN